MKQKLTNTWYDLSQDFTADNTYNIHIPKNCTAYFHYGTATVPTDDDWVATLGENTTAIHKQAVGINLWMRTFNDNSVFNIAWDEQI